MRHQRDLVAEQDCATPANGSSSCIRVMHASMFRQRRMVARSSALSYLHVRNSLSEMNRVHNVRAVVVDDEPAAREAVLSLLMEEDAVQVVGQAGDGRAAVEVIRQTKPDLLFIDVQMPGLDGFQVLESLGAEVPPAVVFVTAHDEHALRAFEVHALDYLLKPFGRPRFQSAVHRAVARLNEHGALSLQRTLAAMAPSLADVANAGSLPRGEAAIAKHPDRLSFRIGTRIVLLELAAITWLEACGDYVRVHTSKESHLVGESLQQLERVLASAKFLRIHRSIMVGLDHVREANREPDGSGAVILEDGVRLRVARSRWGELERALGF